MPPASDASWLRNGHGNLFLEADPEAILERAASSPPGRYQATAPCANRPRTGRTRRRLISRRDRGHAPARCRRRHPAHHATGHLRETAREHLRRADGNARWLAAQLAARPCAALVALALIAATLLALSWMGLAFRNATAARHSADRHAAATTALKQEQTRIATLSGQRPAAIGTGDPASGQIRLQLLHANSARKHRPRLASARPKASPIPPASGRGSSCCDGYRTPRTGATRLTVS
jgi:hypothetical protein